jgi:hypothetical protein
MPTPDQHPSEELFERFSMGTLSEVEAEPFEVHLLVCPACQDRAAEMDSYIRATRAALAAVVRPAPGRRRWVPRFTLPDPVWIFAAAGIALLLTFAVRQDSGPNGTPALAVVVQAQRSVGPGASVPAGKPLVLELDAAGLPHLDSYEVEIVDGLGKPVLRHPARISHERVPLALHGLEAGRYWVRLYGPAPSGEVLREFGLAAE